MIRHYGPLTPELFDQHFLNRREVLRVSDLGAQLGFATSVLDERGFFATSSTADPGAVQAQQVGQDAAGGAGQDSTRPVAKSAPPLLTWPFLDFVESLDLRSKTLLELGAGNSTLWFAQRFGKVRSFETDPEWHRSLASVVGANVELSLVDLDALENAKVEHRGEDWILVDFAGKRTKFIHHFFSKPGRSTKPAAFVLDNADWFRQGAALLKANGYMEIPFYGFKSTQTWLSCTSVFIDQGRFDARLKEPFFQPPFSRQSVNRWDSVE